MGDVFPSQREKGRIVLDEDTGEFAVNVGGAIWTNVWWPTGFSPTIGDSVSVEVQAGEAKVTTAIASAPRPATGIVSGTPSAGRLSVVGSDGVTYSCRYVGTAPADAAEVLLLWPESTPWVVGEAASWAPPVEEDDDDDEVPVAPPNVESGTTRIVPFDSGSRTTAWLFNDVRQGTWGSYSYQGAYFYGSKPNQLAGATVQSARIKLGARTTSGVWDSDLTLNLRRVTNRTKPSGALTFIGAIDVTNVGTAPGTAAWYPLDTAIAQALVDAGGGGIGVSGSPYGGVEGLDHDPFAGTLELTWTR